ncbi:hypothetical protein [Streptomyces acidiscabies]|uniref:hypothetical protein n=1 Tax=Streptomyces acidiscabies TaxID=42234 RepID=UPI000952F84C|nr:hypothetical protein [Streptomyces acidiscabies]GAV42204.1 hypothetical protein Saa2_05126 [Streptomyces acidiscabies]
MGEGAGEYVIAAVRDSAEAAEVRGGSLGLSADAAADVARQVERDNLAELVSAAEDEHGPITEEEIRAVRDRLRHGPCSVLHSAAPGESLEAFQLPFRRVGVG